MQGIVPKVAETETNRNRKRLENLRCTWKKIDLLRLISQVPSICVYKFTINSSSEKGSQYQMVPFGYSFACYVALLLIQQRPPHSITNTIFLQMDLFCSEDKVEATSFSLAHFNYECGCSFPDISFINGFQPPETGYVEIWISFAFFIKLLYAGSPHLSSVGFRIRH